MHTLLRLGGLAGLVALVLAGCTTGQKAYDRGDYSEAVFQATKRLKKDPNNDKARSALFSAYPAATAEHERRLKAAETSRDLFRWEAAISAYSSLNGLAEAVNSTPAAVAILGSQRTYDAELAEARQQAALARYDQGTRRLALGDRENSRLALQHFETATRLVSGFQDADQLAHQARDQATLKIVVNPVFLPDPNMDPTALNSRANQFTESIRTSEFVKVYTSGHAVAAGVTAPDEVVDLTFEPLVLGNLHTEEKSQGYKQPGVVIGQTASNPPQNVIGTVAATATTYTKSLQGTTRLTLRITGPNGAEIDKRVFNSTETWEHKWGTYRGELRAVPPELQQQVQTNDKPAPGPQELFELAAGKALDQAYAQLGKHCRELR